MDDAEAEAALRALGGMLNWKAARADDCVSAQTAKGHYTVYQMPPSCVYIADYRQHGGYGDAHNCPRRFERQADAKAACEHHAVTGAWETLMWRLDAGNRSDEVARTPRGVYRIIVSRKRWPLCSHLVVYAAPSARANYVSPPYKHRADAKAACERHAATGHWE